MKVILLENLKKVGSIGDIIEVKRGFGRNFLIANKKALYASKENISQVQKIKTDLSKKDNDKKQAALKIFEKIDKKESQKYGILKIDELYSSYFKVNDIVEKPLPTKAPSDLSVIGRYVLESKIFKFLNKQKIGVGGEVQLTDGIQYLMKESNVFGYEFEGDRYDCGSKLGFVKANLGFAINDSEIKKEIKNFIKKI